MEWWQGEDAIDFVKEIDFAEYDEADVHAEKERVLAPTLREDGIPPNQLEYKTRRLVNDYLQPPKVTRKMQLAQDRFAETRNDMEQAMVVTNAHELMRSLEVASIMDCADMAAHASCSERRAAGASIITVRTFQSATMRVVLSLAVVKGR